MTAKVVKLVTIKLAMWFGVAVVAQVLPGIPGRMGGMAMANPVTTAQHTRPDQDGDDDDDDRSPHRPDRDTSQTPTQTVPLETKEINSHPLRGNDTPQPITSTVEPVPAPSVGQPQQSNEGNSPTPTATSIAQTPAREPDGDNDGDDADERPQTGDIVVTARQLDTARASVNPSLGASTYMLSNDAIEKRPSGEAANLVNVLLQMPGVAQGGSGELHVRGQRGLQYRINNVIVPGGFSDLADTLRARFADRIELVTGALPAQYGLQVGGVVNITTKSGAYNKGGEVELYGGTQGRFEPAFDAMGTLGKTNYYLSGSFQRNDGGLSAPDASSDPLHDHTDQIDGFAYFDHIIDAQSRLSLIVGVSDDKNDLPHARGLNAATDTANALFQRPLTVSGTFAYPSEAWGGREHLDSQYGIVSYQRTSGSLTAQVSAFLRTSTLSIKPDPVGDLLFTGVAQSVSNRSLSAGLQAEAMVVLSSSHKLRGGITASWTRDRSNAAYLVLPVDSSGHQSATTVQSVPSFEIDKRREFGAYIEDEWQAAKSLTINLGLRFDWVSATGGGRALSPRANLVWKPAPETTLHVGYARYFVPAPDAVGVASANLLVGTTGAWPTATEDPVRAERDDYVDVGIEQKLDHLTLGLDGYWRKARNLLDEVRIGSTALTRPFNYQDGKALGAEVTVTYSNGPFSAWSSLAVARIRGRNINSGQAPFTAAELQWAATHNVATNADQRVTGSAGAAWRSGRLRLSADGVFGSGLPRTVAGGAPNGASMTTYAQVNLAAVYRFTGINRRPLDLRLDLLNALGATYALQDGTSLAHGMPQWASPRGVFVGIEQQF